MQRIFKRGMKQSMAFLLTLMMLLTLVAPVAIAQDNQPQTVSFTVGSMKYSVDETSIESDVAAYIDNGRIMVPVSHISRTFGAVVDWDGQTRTVTVEKGGEITKMVIGDRFMKRDGLLLEEMDVAPVIKDIGNGLGRTMIPASWLARALRMDYGWNNEAKTAFFKPGVENAIGIAAIFNTYGTYGPAEGTKTINSDVKILADGVTLQNYVIKGDLIIDESVGDGNVTLNNIVVEGDTYVRGGGIHSIYINGGSYQNIIVERTSSGAVRIVAVDAEGLEIVVAEEAAGQKVIFEGIFENVTVTAEAVEIELQGETKIQEMVFAESAANVVLTTSEDSEVAQAEVNSIGITFQGAENTVKALSGVADSLVSDLDSVVAAPVAFSGGGGSSSAPKVVSVSAISVDPDVMFLELGKTATVTATVSPRNATNKRVTWSSSDAGVATVENGIVTAVAVGEATITAKAGSYTATCEVNVVEITVDALDNDYYPAGTTLTFDIKGLIEGENKVGILIHTGAGGFPWASDEEVIDGLDQDGEGLYYTGNTIVNGAVTLRVSGTVQPGLPAGNLWITLPDYGIGIDNAIELKDGDNNSVRVGPMVGTSEDYEYQSIQAAIDAATEGDIIEVAAGTYEEKITINKSIVLLGDPGDPDTVGPGPNAPVIDGQNSVGNGFTIAGGVEDVVIEGFKIVHFLQKSGEAAKTGNAIQAYDGDTTNITIRNNYMYDLGYNGVLVGNNSSSRSGNWTISNNYIEKHRLHAIELINTSDSTVQGNAIQGGGRNDSWNPSFKSLNAIGVKVFDQDIDSITIESNQIDGFNYYNLGLCNLYASNANLRSVSIINNHISSAGSNPDMKFEVKTSGGITGITVTGNTLATFKMTDNVELDLNEVLTSNNFPAGSSNIGNEIKVFGLDEAIEAAEEAIAALPEAEEISFSDSGAVENARRLVDSAVNLGAIETNIEGIEKLRAAETKIEGQKTAVEAIEAAEEAIAALPELDNITLGAKGAVENARQLVDVAVDLGAVENDIEGIEHLKIAEAKISLAQAVERAENLDAADYKADSWAVLEATLSDARGVLANKEATREATNQILADLEGAIEGLVEADLTYTVELTFAEGRCHDANPEGFDIRWAGKIIMENENGKNYDGSKEIELWMLGFEHIFLTVDFEDGYGEFDSGWIYYHPSYGGWFTGHENVLLYTNIRIDGVPPVSVWWTPWWDD